MKLVNLFTLAVVCFSQVHSIRAAERAADAVDAAGYFYKSRIPGVRVANLKLKATAERLGESDLYWLRHV